MNEMNGHDIEDLRPGMQATFSKTLTEADIVLFAGVSGDNNAVHVNEEFAATTPFGACIAHGVFTASFVSAIIATRLPGPGSIYISQTLSFRAPVMVGATVDTTIEVLELIERGRRVKLKCECRVDDKVVLTGEAEVKATAKPA